MRSRTRLRYRGLYAGSASWSPFQLGSLLAAWWPSGAAYQFTDASKAVPVASDGDAIRVWADASGNSRDLSQATLANRPLYQSNGGKPYAVGVLTDSVITAAAFTGVQGGTFGIYMACRPERQVANNRCTHWTSGNANNKVAGFVYETGGTVRLTFLRQGDSAGVNTSPNPAMGTDYVFGWEMSGQTLAGGAITGTVSLDDGTPVSVGLGYGEQGAFSLWGGGADVGGPCRIYETVVTTAPLTGTDRTNLIAYLATRY